jgi:hypothetical protein
MLSALLQAGPSVLLVVVCLWKLPEWTRKWIAVARDVREYRSGR